MDEIIRERIGDEWARYVDLDVIALSEARDRKYDSNLTFLGTLEAYYEVHYSNLQKTFFHLNQNPFSTFQNSMFHE